MWASERRRSGAAQGHGPAPDAEQGKGKGHAGPAAEVPAPASEQLRAPGPRWLTAPLLALSLLLNLALLLTRPAPCRSPPEQRQDLATPAFHARAAADVALLAEALWNASMQGGAFRAQQLLRAEATFQAHLRLRAALVGTAQEQAWPLSEAAEQALRYTKDPRWAQMWFKEYMLLPEYPCPEERRVGVWGDGGKWLCMLPLLGKDPREIVVYSVGSSLETSFEEAMWQITGAQAHTFDPFLLPGEAGAMQARSYLRFHHYGLAEGNGTKVRERSTGRTGAAKSIEAMMRDLGHSFVDVLKVDCEGCEVGFVEHLSITTSREQPLFGQILMEIHDAKILEVESGLMRELRQLGFRVFHTEPNVFVPQGCYEVALVHETMVLPERRG